MVFLDAKNIKGQNAPFVCIRGGLVDRAGCSFVVPSSPDSSTVPFGLNVTVTQKKSLTQSYSILPNTLTFSVNGGFSGSFLLATVKSVLPVSQYCRILARHKLDWQVKNNWDLPSFTVCIQAVPAEKNIPRTPQSYRLSLKKCCRMQLATERKGFLRL